MNKKKLFTILFHILGWSGFIFLPLILFDIPGSEAFPWPRIYNFSLMIALFYLNYFILIPKLLLKKRFIIYSLVIVSLLAIIFTIDFPVPESSYRNSRQSSRFEQSESQDNNFNPEMRGRRNQPMLIKKRKSMSGHRRVYNTLSIFIVLLLSSSIRLTREWYKNEKQTHIMAKEKLTSELSFLKSQVNPHFLFNTLNGIYSLANKKSDKTAGAIVKLSELMRHMLYESEKEFISLDKEIEYLENYIDLQKLRLSKEAKVSFDIQGDTSNKKIEPMLLIPFIENAFKHGVDASGADISIELSISENNLQFRVNNRISDSKEKDDNSGIGLSNIIKQLNHLYPGKHTLNIDEKDGYFLIELILNLKN